MADGELSPELAEAAVILAGQGDDVLATGDRGVQMMNVTRLDVVRMMQDYHSFGKKQPAETSTHKQLPSLEGLIEFFIGQYNEGNGTRINESIEEEDDQSSIEFVCSFDICLEDQTSLNKKQPKKNKRDGFKRLVLDERWVRDNEGRGFKLIIYEYHAVSKSKLTAELQKAGSSSADSSNTSRILFYLRKGSVEAGCIYTLTTGHRGYIPLRKYTDYSFSRKIAARLLDGSTIEQEQCKFVLGDVKWMHIARRENPCFDPNDTVKFFTKFEAQLKPHASLYGLSKLGRKKKVDDTPAERIQVEVSLGGIKLKKSLSLAAYPYIMDHYERIVCGESTYEYMTGREENDSEEGFENLFYYTFILDNKLYNTLNDQVIKELVQNIVAPEGCVKKWDFAAPQVKPYYQANEFQLQCSAFGTTRTETFSHRISFKELISILRQLKDEFGCKESALPHLIRNTQLRFKAQGTWQRSCLVDCLTGQVEMRKSDGTVENYFKLNRAWYEIHYNLQKSVDKEFQKCLRECMLFEGDEGFLPDYWAHDEVTEKQVASKLDMEEKDVESLYKRQFSYVDEKTGIVHWYDLSGEIMLDPHFAKCAKSIGILLEDHTEITRELLRNSLEAESASRCEHFWKELVKTRTVGEVYQNHLKQKKLRIRNSYFPKGTNEQKKILSQIANLHNWIKGREYYYNKGYLYTVKNRGADGVAQPFSLDDDFGYLFGDCIIVESIELFDILFYTKNTTYLVQVKKGFAQGIRDACSQLNNSKVIVSKMIENTLKKASFLKKFFEESIKATADESVRNQMSALGYENFEKLFSQNRTIVFVLAFADDRENYYELTREVVAKDRFYPEDFCVKDGPPELGELIFKDLIFQRYLDKDGRRDVKYFNMTSVNHLVFDNPRLEQESQLRKQVYSVLKGGMGKFPSLIARLEVLQLRAKLKRLGFDFKICQIRQPPGLSPTNDDSSGSNLRLNLDDIKLTNEVYRKDGIQFGIEILESEQEQTVFELLFGSFYESRFSCEESSRLKFLGSLTAEYENQTVKSLLKENLKFILIEAAFSVDSEKSISAKHIQCKTEVLFDWMKNQQNLSTLNGQLLQTSKKIKDTLQSTLEFLGKKTNLGPEFKSKFGFHEKATLVRVKKWFSKHMFWYDKEIRRTLKNIPESKSKAIVKLKEDIRKLDRFHNDLDGYLGELLASPLFSEHLKNYFEKTVSFTPYEVELVAFLAESRVEILKRIYSDNEYVCVNSHSFHEDKELVLLVQTENDLVYRKCN